jgi:hypothetical protein
MRIGPALSRGRTGHPDTMNRVQAADDFALALGRPRLGAGGRRSTDPSPALPVLGGDAPCAPR